MKKRGLIIIIFCCLVGFSNNIYTQDCENYFESQCIMPSDWDYEVNSQSMNIPMFQGQSIKYSAVFYEGFEYSISFCADEGLGTVQYRLLSTDVYVDKTFNSTYDNNMAQVEFINKSTRIILVEVTVKRTSGEIDPNNRKCLGIIIGQRKSEEF